MVEYNQGDIRQLIDSACEDDALQNLCYDHFHPIYEQFTTGQTRGDRVRKLAEYVERQREIPKLLEKIQEINPNVYAEFKQRLSLNRVDLDQSSLDIPPANSGNSLKQSNAEERLKKLSFDTQVVDMINLRLEAIEKIRKTDRLAEDEEEEFNVLKHQVNSLLKINQEIAEIEERSQQLIENVERSLTLKREEVSSSLEKAGYDQKIEIVQRFLRNIKDGKATAKWLNQQQRQTFARSAGKRALDDYPEIKNNATQREIEDFYLSIEQFLEQVGQCLTWGRSNILDAPGIPLVFDYRVYETALNLIKGMLPSHLSYEMVAQLRDFIEYIVRKLPLYPSK
jgi:hypothetical protein